MPIIQIKDDRLSHGIDQIEVAGADGCSFMDHSNINALYELMSFAVIC